MSQNKSGFRLNILTSGSRLLNSYPIESILTVV
jgi:hypothetical protein